MDRCCFDFLLHGVATNNPESWKISYALSQSVLGPKGDKIISLEKALRCRKIPPGEERFVVKQGTSCHINFGDGADGVVVTAPLYDEIPAVAAVPASGPKLFTV